MRPSLSVFATLALAKQVAAQTAPPPEYLSFDAFGTVVQIDPAAELQYDQNQNGSGSGAAPTVSADHTTLRTVGNRWSAYELPSTLTITEETVLQFAFTLDVETVSGFQAICLDADRELTGSNGQCFALTTTQGWIDNFINAAKLTGLGETTYQNIPIGRFFTGPVNYIAFVQDSDAGDRPGDSSFANIRLIEQSRNKLNIEIDNTMTQIENHQLSYTFKSGLQDIDDWLMEISEDGDSIQVNGNQWKAMPLNAPYLVNKDTMIEFGIVVNEPGDLHAICLDSNLDAARDEKPCITFMTHPDEAFHILETEVEAGVPKTLTIPFGHMMGLGDGETLEVSYIVFVQDHDVGDKRGGQSTYSNIRIYEEAKTPVSITVAGAEVIVPNTQLSFTSSSNSAYVQDTREHVMSVTDGGKTLTAHGNSYKAFAFPEVVDVKPSTVVKFRFDVTTEVEWHYFCFFQDRLNVYGGLRNNCLATSGWEASSNSDTVMLDPFLTGTNGVGHDYEVWIGTYFTGPVQWFGFGQDNDKTRTATRDIGESSWSNIEIYDLPSIRIGLDDGFFEIPNEQKSYESSSQDNTPIRDYPVYVSEDGSTVSVTSNAWRYFPLETPMSAAELGDFVVSFDYMITDPGEIHGVCFEDNNEWGNSDDPIANEYDPNRCLILNHFQDINRGFLLFEEYEPALNEPKHYVVNLSKLFDRFYEWDRLVFLQDNDIGDKSGGQTSFSNFHITTSLTSCMNGTNFEFVVSDCTVPNFLAGTKAQMMANSCSGDPLLELMALWDATTEQDVYKKINHICTSSYQADQFDFAKTISPETQVFGEYIDGGTILNYESDALGGNLAKDGAAIAAADAFASSKLFTYPKHHALDYCDAGVAMCCMVDSRGTTDLVNNTDVCYTNMKSSRYTAHVADGYSIYGDGSAGAVNCQGFAWGTDSGSIGSALKGNALFKVGFMNELYAGMKGSVEQVPGAPMCGCIDRMPVVSNAGCLKASDDTSTVTVSYSATTGAFSSDYAMGSIQYSDCGDLNTYYKSLVGETSHMADYIDTRITGDAGCGGAINDFLSTKGLTTA